MSSRTWTGPFVLSPVNLQPMSHGMWSRGCSSVGVWNAPSILCLQAGTSVGVFHLCFVLSELNIKGHDPLIDIGWMILFNSRALQKRHKVWIRHDRMSSVDPQQPWSLRRPASYATSSPNGFLSNLVLDLASECLVQELPNLGPVWPVMAFSASFRQPALVSCFRSGCFRSQSRMMPATVQ